MEKRKHLQELSEVYFCRCLLVNHLIFQELSQITSITRNSELEVLFILLGSNSQKQVIEPV